MSGKYFLSLCGVRTHVLARQADELAFQGTFRPETKAIVVTGLPSPYGKAATCMGPQPRDGNHHVLSRFGSGEEINIRRSE